jgi:membrane protein
MKKRVVKLLKIEQTLHRLENKLKAVHFGKYNISLHRFLEILKGKLESDHIIEMSRAMAFSFILSIFPAIIFLFTLIPYIPIEHLDVAILTSLESLLPRGIYEVAEETVYDIVARPQSGLLSFGFLFTVYAAINGIVAMITVFNKCYSSNDTRSFFKRIFVSVQILFLLVLCVVSSIALQIAVEYIFSKMNIYQQGQVVILSIIRYLLPYALLLVCISLIYSLAPAVTRRWRFFSLGSLVAAFLTMAFSIAFVLYFNNFSSYNKVYGSIGALIGLMLWIFSMSAILLLGFEINASIEIARNERKKHM